MSKMLIAKRDVKGFCIDDADGNELIFDLAKGIKIFVNSVEYDAETDAGEMTVHLFSPEDEYIVLADDFDVL